MYTEAADQWDRGSWESACFSARWQNSMVLTSVQKGNVWQPNTIRHCLATKHVDATLSGQAVSNTFERTKCFTMFDQMFDFVQILLNAIQHGQTRCPNGKMTGQQTILDRVIFSPQFFLIWISHLIYKVHYLLIVFDRQAFSIWTGLHTFSRAARRDKISFCTRRYCGIKGFVRFSRHFSYLQKEDVKILKSFGQPLE